MIGAFARGAALAAACAAAVLGVPPASAGASVSAAGPAASMSWWPAAKSAGGAGTSTPGGTIRGRVVDRTAPAHPVAGQDVRLRIIERGTSDERRTRTDAAGEFAFAGLPLGGIRLFLVSTVYGDVEYGSERIALSHDAPSRRVLLPVYEPAGDRRAVRVALVFAIVDIARGALRVSAVQRFENRSDRTVVTTPADPLIVPLPAGAKDVAFLDGWRDPRAGGGGIVDALPLRPGDTTVAYAYGLGARSTVDVPWRLPDGAGDVEILVADTGPRVTAAGLRETGAVVEAGRRYRRLSGGPVPAGGEVVLHLVGVPEASDPWPPAVAAALALVLGVALVLSLRRGRPPDEVATGGVRGGEARGPVEGACPARVSPPSRL